MVETILRCLGIEPDIRLTGRAEGALSLGTSSSYDEWKFVNSRGPVTSLADETLVLCMRDRSDRNEEIVEMDSMPWLLVCIRVIGPHDEIARRDECEFGEQVSHV